MGFLGLGLLGMFCFVFNFIFRNIYFILPARFFCARPDRCEAPVIGIEAPEIYEDSSEARKRTTFAISSGLLTLADIGPLVTGL